MCSHIRKFESESIPRMEGAKPQLHSRHIACDDLNEHGENRLQRQYGYLAMFNVQRNETRASHRRLRITLECKQASTVLRCKGRSIDRQPLVQIASSFGWPREVTRSRQSLDGATSRELAGCAGILGSTREYSDRGCSNMRMRRGRSLALGCTSC